MKKYAILLILFTILFLQSCGNQKNTSSFEAMNTFMTITSYGSKAQKANQLAQKRVMDIEKAISTTYTESDIYKLNNLQDKLLCKNDTYSLIMFGLEFSDKTNGALNITLYPVTSAWGFTTGKYRIPDENEIQELLKLTDFSKINLLSDNTVELAPNMKLDLGAIGKGYAGDRAIEVLRENGIKSALLDLGGNIQALGTKPDGSLWKIGIKNPWQGPAVAGISIKDKAVITSGGYERHFTGDDGKEYIHIFDGKTGHPVENEIASITIICDSGLYGDALSTALFVSGIEEAINFWKSTQDFQMLIISKDKKLYYTKDLSDNLSVHYDFAEIIRIF